MTTTIRRGKEVKKKKEKGNATRVNSCRGLICHMIGAKVSTSVNFPCLPRRGGWNE
jgi:hypothetical protein